MEFFSKVFNLVVVLLICLLWLIWYTILTANPGVCSSNQVNFFSFVADVTPATFETPEVHPGGLPVVNKSKAGIRTAEEGSRIMFL